MINYILQVVLFQVLFLTIYDFFLSKETFFTKNRLYLLTTPVLSFIIPLIKVPTFKKVVPQEVIIQLPEIVLSPEKVIEQSHWYQSVNYIDIVFIFGVVLFSGLFFYKLYQIFQLIRFSAIEKHPYYTLVILSKQSKAFSFFNFIFLGTTISDAQREKIIQHELVHSKQKHSLDLLFFEILKIVMWFNPMIFIYQKRITLVHEYISDEVASKSESKETYINSLLSNFFQVENIAFINQFYKQSLLKKRITMMTKTQSKKLNQLKYLLLLPMLIGMLFYTSCSETEIPRDIIGKKEIQTSYFNNKGKLKETKGKTETYLDTYIGIGEKFQLPEGEEVKFENLAKEEQEEFLRKKNRMDSLTNVRGIESFFDLRIFKYKKGRKVVALVPNFKRTDTQVERLETEEVSFMTIDKAPTFPGCETSDKDCFSLGVQKHFVKGFNAKMVNKLGLDSGRKRVFVGFKVDKEGNVVDINARAPHKAIKEEVISVMSTLPKMTPGEQDGKKVDVKYTIPITITVE